MITIISDFNSIHFDFNIPENTSRPKYGKRYCSKYILLQYLENYI